MRKDLLAAAAAAALLGCQAKEKPQKFLTSGSMNPPWDSPAFNPKRLDGYVYAGPESLFAVFPAIARLDSAAGDRATWKADPKALDTFQLSQIFDTGFVFPAKPEAGMPYAYDDSYRDDTLYRNFYGNGLFTQDHPCAVTYVLSDGFMHPARWLKAGLTQAELVGGLGRPTYWNGDTADAVLRYLSHQVEGAGRGQAMDSGEVASADAAKSGSQPNTFYEGANFYFRNDSLFAAVLQRSQPCH